jgi:hypothetical protein
MLKTNLNPGKKQLRIPLKRGKFDDPRYPVPHEQIIGAPSMSTMIDA